MKKAAKENTDRVRLDLCCCGMVFKCRRLTDREFNRTQSEVKIIKGVFRLAKKPVDFFVFERVFD